MCLGVSFRGGIDWPYTFPASAFSDPGYNYTYSMTAWAASFNINNANPQFYFPIYLEAVTTVGH
jgi:hypothetical protein